jgi:hypothetical protein
MRRLIIVTLLLVSCQTTNKIESSVDGSIDSRLLPHVEEFDALAKAVGLAPGYPINSVKVVDSLPGMSVATCEIIHYARGKDKWMVRNVTILKPYLISEWFARMLIFHEMMHCRYGILEHDEKWDSFMNAEPIFLESHWKDNLYQQVIDLFVEINKGERNVNH